MHALVCGLPRSGTTLVANLMHNPAEKRICLVEPLLNGHSGYLKSRVFDHLNVTNETKIRLQDLPLHIPDGHKWAVKECWAERYRYAYEHGKPKMVIFVIRNLLDLMLSSYRFADDKIGVDNKVKAVKEFLEFWGKARQDGKNACVIFYELLCLCEGDGCDISDWPLNGDPNRDLKAYGRASEIRDGFAPRNVNPTYPDEVLEIVNQCQDYQKAFGYNKEARDD